jgi:hypothetical protein
VKNFSCNKLDQKYLRRQKADVITKKTALVFLIKIHPPTEEGENLGGSKSAYKNNELK